MSQSACRTCGKKIASKFRCGECQSEIRRIAALHQWAARRMNCPADRIGREERIQGHIARVRGEENSNGR